jgi:HK97 family phage major capsid protein
VDSPLGSFLLVKSVDAPARTFRGIATTPAVDSGGDSVDPFGVVYANPLPLLLHHDPKQVIGQATFGTPTSAGIPFTASIPVITEPGALRDRCDEAWQSIVAGLLQAVSIGWLPLADGIEYLKSGARRLRKIEVRELSLTPIPSNREAAILAFKSLGAAAGSFSPGDTGRITGSTMTTSEQITALEGDKAADVSRMGELLGGGPALEGEAATEYDGLILKVKSAEDSIGRLKAFEAANVGSARPVTLAAGAPRPYLRPKSQLPAGTLAARYCMALIVGKGSRSDAADYAAARWRDTPEVGLAFKAAVAPATTTDANWAKPLVQIPGFGQELIELVQPLSVIGRLTGLSEVPFGVPVPIETAGATVNWVGEVKPKPVSKGALTSDSVPNSKIAGIIAFSEELARSSSPKAEQVFRKMLVNGIAKFRDEQFLDPAVASVVGVKPGSITNGIVGTPATADPAADINLMLSKFVIAGIPLSSITIILSEGNAFALGLQRTPMGEPMFPSLGAEGGTIGGIKVLASNAAKSNVIGVSTPYILVADDGGITVDLSREASLQMSDAPVDDGTQVLVSLWQNNLIGLRAEQFIGWKRAVSGSVQLVTGAAYAPTVINQGGTTHQGGLPIGGKH